MMRSESVQYGGYEIIIEGSTVKLPDVIVCPRCNGCGENRDDVDTEERGRLVVDACYHCRNTGTVEGEELLDGMLSELAARKVDEAWKTYSQPDPEGWSWEMDAAENMMSRYDYRRAWEMSRMDAEMQRLSNLTAIQVVRYWTAVQRGWKVSY